MPLVDLAKFARISAADRAAEAAGHREEAIGRQTEGQVAQLYYQLAADLALADVARLPVREVVSALHFKADLTLGLGTVAFDYLAK